MLDYGNINPLNVESIEKFRLCLTIFLKLNDNIFPHMENPFFHRLG